MGFEISHGHSSGKCFYTFGNVDLTLERGRRHAEAASPWKKMMILMVHSLKPNERLKLFGFIWWVLEMEAKRTKNHFTILFDY